MVGGEALGEHGEPLHSYIPTFLRACVVGGEALGEHGEPLAIEGQPRVGCLEVRDELIHGLGLRWSHEGVALGG